MRAYLFHSGHFEDTALNFMCNKVIDFSYLHKSLMLEADLLRGTLTNQRSIFVRSNKNVALSLKKKNTKKHAVYS